MLKKNDEITLTIDAMTTEGSGIGRHEGIAVFVPNTAVGDTVLCHIIKAKKNEIAMMHISIKASTNALKTHCLSLPMYASGFSGPSYFVLSFRLFVSFFMSSLLLI